jgi:hypothetical protein
VDGVDGWMVAVGDDAGLLLLTLARVLCWLYFLSLLAGYSRSHSVRDWGAGLMVGGRARCRVAAAYVSAGYMLAVFFITISHCARLFAFALGVFRGRATGGGQGQCRVAAA